MKISILTATYNRADDIERLYTSLVINSNSNIDFEWLIMDDGSTDKTKIIVDNFIKQGIIDVHYYYQENQGKMCAINNLMQYVTGDIVMDCDSDDSLCIDALSTIKKYSDKLLNDETVYALVFLKKNEKGKISGNKFPENCYRSDINKAIIIGDYQNDGYTKNINDIFKANPNGYYEYFREILKMNLKGVTLKKKMYIYKHYILFSNLSKKCGAIKNVDGFINKLIISILWIPGKIKSKNFDKMR